MRFATYIVLSGLVALLLFVGVAVNLSSDGTAPDIVAAFGAAFLVAWLVQNGVIARGLMRSDDDPPPTLVALLDCEVFSRREAASEIEDRVFGGDSVARALDERDRELATVRPGPRPPDDPPAPTMPSTGVKWGCPACGRVTEGASATRCQFCGAPLER